VTGACVSDCSRDWNRPRREKFVGKTSGEDFFEKEIGSPKPARARSARVKATIPWWRALSGSESIGVPVRVQGPAGTRTALGRSPLLQACWANSSCVEGVPGAAATARPEVVFAWRPTTQRASDARAGQPETFLFLKLRIQDNGRISGGIREGAHYTLLRTQPSDRIKRESRYPSFRRLGPEHGQFTDRQR
jgi:hypothetical protein